MKNIIDQILDENNHDVLRIPGKNKEVFSFEQIALLEIEDCYYTILHPLAADVGVDDVLVFRIDCSEEEATMVLEEDEEILAECLNQYEQLYQHKNGKK